MTRFVTFASRAVVASALFAVPLAAFAQSGSPTAPTAGTTAPNTAPGTMPNTAPGTMPDAKAGTPAASVTSPTAVPEKTQAHSGTAAHGKTATPKSHVSKDTGHSTTKSAPVHGQTHAKSGGAS
ncbi:MAG: hypothetical protein BGO51_05000 [Rhodospirillales bacterium 69-11]|nr:hypothetical protein [Rhodospirillales bacterium]OJW27101.1 MAG: hypothetical protein BGO51_05000 [Rhodospirillales bacterium 69-11]